MAASGRARAERVRAANAVRVFMMVLLDGGGLCSTSITAPGSELPLVAGPRTLVATSPGQHPWDGNPLARQVTSGGQSRPDVRPADTGGDQRGAQFWGVGGQEDRWVPDPPGTVTEP